jgi:hypothetical protein
MLPGASRLNGYLFAFLTTLRFSSPQEWQYVCQGEYSIFLLRNQMVKWIRPSCRTEKKQQKCSQMVS